MTLYCPGSGRTHACSLVALLAITVGSFGSAFLPIPPCSSSSSSSSSSSRTFPTRPFSTTSLWFGLSEWRSKSLEENRTLLLLPYSMEEALLPGQSQTVVFKEGRFIDLLDEATEDHCHIIGTVLMGQDSMLPVMPLCHISAFSLQAGYRGKVTATVTLQCVGRAQLAEMKQWKPYMKGKCFEVTDNDNNSPDVTVDLQACQEIVHDIEQMILASSSSSSSSSTSTTNPTSSQNAVYQQSFWSALAVLGYQPTNLLTRDPTATNSQKELQAASWAILTLVSDPEQRYQGMECQNLLERLQLGRRALLQESFQRTSSSSSTSLFATNQNTSSSSSNSNLYGESGFE